ncbi:MAG: hypothetical protein ACOYN6_11040 [Ignavibacteria bacterium]
MEVKKNSVVIPLEMWNELKEIDYFKELIEVLEDSRELEKAKVKTKSFMNLDNYIKERSLKEVGKKNKITRSNKIKKTYV